MKASAARAVAHGRETIRQQDYIADVPAMVTPDEQVQHGQEMTITCRRPSHDVRARSARRWELPQHEERSPSFFVLGQIGGTRGLADDSMCGHSTSTTSFQPTLVGVEATRSVSLGYLKTVWGPGSDSGIVGKVLIEALPIMVKTARPDEDRKWVATARRAIQLLFPSPRHPETSRWSSSVAAGRIPVSLVASTSPLVAVRTSTRYHTTVLKHT
ncbi:hypothetical protein BKA62DRAFT_376684 [Auriculariales sp. MPI-PUGE-AT-0066]|nr:hypothetical protein BKA62DRAFT_376684 [Auriculariales sp. MPI-PUGE-AT-0066]